MPELEYAEMFGCDTARVRTVSGRRFLILGWNRTTRGEADYWEKDGERVDFDYLEEKAVASGDTDDELMASAVEYKRLTGMTMIEYLSEVTGVDLACDDPEFIDLLETLDHA